MSNNADLTAFPSARKIGHLLDQAGFEPGRLHTHADGVAWHGKVSWLTKQLLDRLGQPP